MSKTISTAMTRQRNKELRGLKRDRKQQAAIALRELTSLRKQADKIVARHRELEAKITRRIAIVEGRLC